uniref:PHD domain-containing protein n=1 Tax=Caenorhabditis tropicalis TaxID=1561998 RepID=A0A1I7U672_9PELO
MNLRSRTKPSRAYNTRSAATSSNFAVPTTSSPIASSTSNANNSAPTSSKTVSSSSIATTSTSTATTAASSSNSTHLSSVPSSSASKIIAKTSRNIVATSSTSTAPAIHSSCQPSTSAAANNQTTTKGLIRCRCRNQKNQPSVPYIECQVCETWQHMKCMKINEEDHRPDDEYKCWKCIGPGYWTRENGSDLWKLFEKKAANTDEPILLEKFYKEALKEIRKADNSPFSVHTIQKKLHDELYSLMRSDADVMQKIEYAFKSKIEVPKTLEYIFNTQGTVTWGTRKRMVVAFLPKNPSGKPSAKKRRREPTPISDQSDDEEELDFDAPTSAPGSPSIGPSWPPSPACSPGPYSVPGPSTAPGPSSSAQPLPSQGPSMPGPSLSQKPPSMPEPSTVPKPSLSQRPSSPLPSTSAADDAPGTSDRPKKIIKQEPEDEEHYVKGERKATLKIKYAENLRESIKSFFHFLIIISFSVIEHRVGPFLEMVKNRLKDTNTISHEFGKFLDEIDKRMGKETKKMKAIVYPDAMVGQLKEAFLQISDKILPSPDDELMTFNDFVLAKDFLDKRFVYLSKYWELWTKKAGELEALVKEKIKELNPNDVIPIKELVEILKRIFYYFF